MGRKKKVKDSLIKKARKATNKSKPGNKPRYISKADRADPLDPGQASEEQQRGEQ